MRPPPGGGLQCRNATIGRASGQVTTWVVASHPQASERLSSLARLAVGADLPLRRRRRLHRHGRWPATSSRSSRTRARSPRSCCSALAREMNFSETVFVSRRAATATRASGSSRRGRAAVRRASRRSARPSCSAGRCSSSEIRLETGSGVVPVALERDGAPDRLRADGAAAADRRAVRARGRAAARRSASRAPSCRSSSTTTASGTCTSCSRVGGAVAALRPDIGRLELRSAASASTASPARARAGRRACSRPATAWPRIRRPARRRARSRCHLAATGGSRAATEIEIRQGAEIGRPSTLYARVDGAADGDRAVEVGGAAVVVARGEFRLP